MNYSNTSNNDNNYYFYIAHASIPWMPRRLLESKRLIFTLALAHLPSSAKRIR